MTIDDVKLIDFSNLDNQTKIEEVVENILTMEHSQIKESVIYILDNFYNLSDEKNQENPEKNVSNFLKHEKLQGFITEIYNEINE